MKKCNVCWPKIFKKIWYVDLDELIRKDKVLMVLQQDVKKIRFENENFKFLESSKKRQKILGIARDELIRKTQHVNVVLDF